MGSVVSVEDTRISTITKILAFSKDYIEIFFYFLFLFLYNLWLLEASSLPFISFNLVDYILSIQSSLDRRVTQFRTSFQILLVDL